MIRLQAAVALLGKVREAAAIEFSPRLPRWSRLPKDRTVSSELRYAATRAGPLAGSSRRGRMSLALVGLLWPAKATCDAIWAVARYGLRVKSLSGVGCLRQWRDAMTLAHAWNYSPRTYYTFRFWDAAIRPKATTFLQDHEIVVLNMLLNRQRRTDLSQDKWSFAARCAAAGIPTPRRVARIGEGEEEWVSEGSVLPRLDLFIKPVSGKQGVGGERWVYAASVQRWSRKGLAFTELELLAHCRQVARTRPIVIQHCLSNHPELARYSAGPLCSFRVITYGEANHPAAVLGVTFKIARGGSDVDNLHARAIACPVDPVSGRLGSGIGLDPLEPRWRKHPETGATLEGARLATVGDVVDLALAAHSKLDVTWSVGWDVAMTPEGAVLVEGNTLWGVDIFELPHARGLEGEFAEHLLKRVRDAMAECRSALPRPAGGR